MDPERWRQIEKVYHDALRVDPGRRAEFLRSACGSDPDLRREVESLLNQEVSAAEFLEKPAWEDAGTELYETRTSPLIPGARLGAYTIEATLGSGGMGVVYRARDTKLDRAVAIKVLPERFSGDSERLSRFQREARMLAALNHPNIAGIHGLEEAGGAHYLVMELVPGQTLAQRLSAGPVDMKQGLRYCAQIAEALEAAHEKNILHRDLKPANVNITPEGRIKLLDFGLAKTFRGDSGVKQSSAETVTEETRPGVVLGTAAYMSPEQAGGKPLDKRTDIWSFGCVLFEVLAREKIPRTI
jgi:eukaryotic-like serine/threonine-protein kinase